MYKVLLVDDEVREMNIIKILLERQYTEQFVFYEATNGEEAVAQFEEYEPQLIFMDIRMPGMSGIDAVKAIRNQCKEVYIIMITAYNYFEFAKEAIGVGVNDFLLKPPSRSNINQAVDKFFAYIQQQEQMKKNVEQTKEKLDYWMQQMKKELAISLAYNSIEKQQIDDCFHMLGIAYNWGMCVIFSIEKMVMNNKQYEIRSICNKIDCFIQEQHISAISGILGKNIILFLLLDKQTREQCKQQAYNLIDEVKIYIQRTYGAHIKIGIGSEYIFVYELHKSYEEALVAIKQEESISKQQRIETNEGQYEKLLSKKIREGNENEAFVFLTEAFTVLHMKYKDHPAILKVRCIEFLSSITKSCLPKEQVGTYLDLIGSLIE
jgi:two-component system response regulator YesN